MDTIDFKNLEHLKRQVVERTSLLHKQVLHERLPTVQHLDEMRQTAVVDVEGVPWIAARCPTTCSCAGCRRSLVRTGASKQ